MKYIPLALIIIIYSCAPKITVEKQEYPSPFEFSIVDTVHADKNTIYVRAHEWLAKTFVSAEAVIDMQDKEAGKLIGKSSIPVTYTTVTALSGRVTASQEVRYIISIDVKEGKYRCIISNFSHRGDEYTNSYGDLQAEKFEAVNPATGGKFEDRSYYAVKNQVMMFSKLLLKDLRIKMHEQNDDF